MRLYNEKEDVWRTIPAVVYGTLFILMYSWNKFSTCKFSSWQHWRCFVVAAGYGSVAAATSAHDGVVRGGILFWLND